MPTFKHPCPYCGKYIEGSAVACPFCGVTEPFTHGRCPDCRAVLEAGWIACPRCGRTIIADGISPAAIGTTGAEMATPQVQPATVRKTPPPTAAVCTGCGAPLQAGARFCRACGTLVA